MILAMTILIAVGLTTDVFLPTPTTESLRLQFQLALESRDWKAVNAIGRRWTTVSPESGEAWRKWADSLLKQGKYQEANECLNRVPLDSKEAETALLTQIELLFGPMNQPAAGAVCCEKLLAKNPKSAVAQQRFIFFLTMTLQRPRMIQQIRQAMELGVEPRESYIYLFFADSLFFANAAELNNQWLAGDPDSELYEVAIAIFTSESLDFSVSLDDRESAEITRRAQSLKASVLDHLLEKYPHNSEILAYNIRRRIQAGDGSTAVNLLAQATVEAENDHRFWRFKGWVHAERNQWDEAEGSYRHALQLHPMDWSTRHLLAELLQKQQRFDEVKVQRELVSRANELRRTLQAIPNARHVSQEVMSRLADYASDCGDTQISETLRKRFQKYQRI